MDAFIKPSTLEGEVHCIPSKSYAHRLLICAAFSNAPTDIFINTQFSKDIEATIGCLKALCCNVEKKSDNCITVYPAHSIAKSPVLNCIESGSTLRFLLPVAATIGNDATFEGTGRLPSRPLTVLLNQLKEHDVTFTSNSLPTTLGGKMSCGVFELPGDISSQFVTGLLLSLPLTKDGGEIRLTSPLESKSYVDITVEVMKKFGIEVESTGTGYIVPANSHYFSPKQITVQGDWSNAAFWLCCGALNKKMTCTGLDFNSAQGDKAIVDILKLYGADIEQGTDFISVSPKERKSFCIDAKDIPDLVPIVCVLASVATGVSKIKNTQRLKLKECDRIDAVINLLQSLGSKASYCDGELTIYGNNNLTGGSVNGFNDHRIVMSAAIASTMSTNDVKITDAQAILKSYPNFFDDFKKLGGNINVI